MPTDKATPSAASTSRNEELERLDELTREGMQAYRDGKIPADCLYPRPDWDTWFHGWLLQAERQGNPITTSQARGLRRTGQPKTHASTRES